MSTITTMSTKAKSIITSMSTKRSTTIIMPRM